MCNVTYVLYCHRFLIIIKYNTSDICLDLEGLGTKSSIRRKPMIDWSKVTVTTNLIKLTVNIYSISYADSFTSYSNLM